jgi:hypothetical protein
MSSSDDAMSVKSFKSTKRYYILCYFCYFVILTPCRQVQCHWMTRSGQSHQHIRGDPTVAQKTVPVFGHFVMFGL